MASYVLKLLVDLGTVCCGVCEVVVFTKHRWVRLHADAMCNLQCEACQRVNATIHCLYAGLESTDGRPHTE